jgi:hypothetical protein
MEPASNKNLLPVNAIDRMISSYTGGINTQGYYEAVYLAPDPQKKTNYVEVNEDGVPIVYINGSKLPPTETVTKPGLTPQEITTKNSTTGVTQTSAGSGKKEYTVLTPTGFASTLVQGVFSVAVTIAIIMGIVVTYLIIRTRQLHHHEEHIRAAAPGHGGGHAGGHGQIHDAHPHDSHGIPVPHGPTHHHAPDHDHHHNDAEGAPQETIQEEPAHMLVDLAEVPAVSDLNESTVEHGDTTNSDVANRLSDIRDYARGTDTVLWRHALMDIDLILEDLLARKNIPGNNTTERLANTDVTKLSSLNDALTAHAFYEQMTSGVEPINAQSMQRLLALYEPIFSELGLK